MIVFLLIGTLIWQRAGAIPLSAGPTTAPTIVHNIVLGVFARTSCSDTRSMYEIVRSGLFTIAACVYRAIHPNIPDPNASFWEKLRVTFKVTIYALIAPEMVIWWALRQRFAANILAEKINAIKPELKWTQTHGQFAQMGGFGRKDTKHVLYPITLIELLREGRIDGEELQLTEKEINDKSKGDILSKGLLAFQTTWFVFECMARLQQGLPIIELEVVTLAFATLNVITYALWWYKPLNVMCPIYLHIRPTPSTTPTNSNSESPPQEIPSIAEENEELFLGGREPRVVELDVVQGGGPITQGNPMVRNTMTVVHSTVIRVIGDIERELREDGWLLTAWKRLVVQPFVAIVWPLADLLGDEDVHPQATHVSIFYGMEIPQETEDRVLLFSSVIGLIFGAIHFFSWNSTFPTYAQLILWRTSSIIMVIQPLLILLMDVCVLLWRRLPSGSRMEAIAEWFRYLFQLVSMFGGTIPYILARFCVLVLAFLTLRDLPLGAFNNVSWTTYIPHF